MLKHALEVWASVFSNHAALRTAIDFAHVGGLLGGGGAAVAADRAAIVAARGTPPAVLSIDSFHRTHRLVLAGISVIVVSGLLLAASDVETYLHSRVFWLKMGFFVLLLLNGSQLMRAERAARAGDRGGRRRLRVLAMTSLALWFLTTLAGTALPNLT